MGRWWSRPWDGKDAHNCFLLSGPSALLWGLSLSGPLTSGSWLPFWFAWSLVLGLQVPHVLTLPCPLAPFPVLGGLSHLLPSYMASSVWTWGSSFMKYDLYMPASSSESFREPWPGASGNTYVFSEKPPPSLHHCFRSPTGLSGPSVYTDW